MLNIKSLIMAAAAAAAVAGGFDMANTGLQAYWNRKEAATAYQRELDIMNYQNAYNSPSAQMQRYKDAGLNPNLVYSQGTSGNTATSSPSYKPAQAPTSNLSSSVVGTYQQQEQIDNVIKTSSSQRTLYEANALKAFQDTLTSIAREGNLDAGTQNIQQSTKKLEEDTKTSSIIAQYAEEVQVKNLKAIEANIDNIMSRTDVNESELRSMQVERAFKKKGMEKMNQELQNLKQTWKNMKEDEKIKQLEQLARKAKLHYSDFGVDDSNIFSSFGKMVVKNIIDPIDQPKYSRYRGGGNTW